MERTTPASSPDAYVEALSGWQRECVEALRAAVRKQSSLEEVVKWRHLVYLADGPAILIRAEEKRVLLGFWRGQLLRSIVPRHKAGGKYEMATLDISDGMIIDSTMVRRLASEAVSLNKRIGDPTKAV